VPLASLRRALEAALAIALTAGLDPHQRIDNRVVGLGRGSRSESGGVDVAPLTSLLTGTGEMDAALVHDKVSWETLLLEEGGERGGVVGLIPRVASTQCSSRRRWR